MERLSLEKYWERLERHDWFYPWAEETPEYGVLVEETTKLFHFSRLSEEHAQLYATYWFMMYIGMDLENDSVMNLELPAHRKPEAA